MNLKYFGALILALLAIIFAGIYYGTDFRENFVSSLNESSEESQIRISINSWPGFGPLFIAKEKGFFSPYNFEIVRMDDSASRRSELLSGRINILGSTIDDMAVAMSIGIDVKAYGCADFSNGADGILVSNEINSLQELSTSQVAVDPGFVNHFFLLYVLKKNGLPTDQIDLLAMSPDDAGAAFLAGQIDAAVTWEPYLSQSLSARQGSTLIASTKDYPEAILDLFIANPVWAENNSEAMSAFRAGWGEAVRFYHENPEEAVAIIAKNLEMDETLVGDIFLDIELLEQQSCKNLLESKWAELSNDVVELWSQAGFLTREIDLNNALSLD